ncbi:MAG: hypothetical protein K8W52_20445 [Deltaproteobacteria bacterium]|nr:hypothetical protein [Deltaproteobacteria bacterium]
MSARSQPPKRRLRRLVVPAALVAAIVLAVMYLRCGGGFGLGGGSSVGLGKGTGSAGTAGAGSDGTARAALDRPADAGVPRCQVRVTGAGLELDGAVATREAIVTACTTAGAADVTVTGDARQGLWDDLKGALTAAGVTTFVRDPQAAPTDAAPGPTSDAAP